MTVGKSVVRMSLAKEELPKQGITPTTIKQSSFATRRPRQSSLEGGPSEMTRALPNSEERCQVESCGENYVKKKCIARACCNFLTSVSRTTT